MEPFSTSLPATPRQAAASIPNGADAAPMYPGPGCSPGVLTLHNNRRRRPVGIDPAAAHAFSQ